MASLSNIAGFNPRQVPVVGVDAHLAAVPRERLSAPALRERFARPPVWEPELRAEPPIVNQALREAAVLVPIVMHGEPTVLLTQRAAQLRAHSGQIAFAGGKVDAQDASPQAAALREAQEEIGLMPGWVDVLGSLPHYTTGTAFRITPVVALVQPGFELQLNAAEVDAAFEVPLAYLMNPAQHQRHEVVWDLGQGPVRREWFSMPYMQALNAREIAQLQHPQDEPLIERFIWGATAGMLRNLYRFLVA